VGAETTFERDIQSMEEVVPALAPVLAKVWAAYSTTGLAGRTVTVKVKYADFQQITRSRSCTDAIASPAVIKGLTFDLLRQLFPTQRGVRLLGVTVSNLDAAERPIQQLALPIA